MLHFWDRFRNSLSVIVFSRFFFLGSVDGGHKRMKKYEFKHISVVTASMILLETKTDSFENPLLNVVGALNSFTNTKKKM